MGLAAGGFIDAGIDGVAALEAVVVGLERVVGYIVAEQKNQKLETSLLCSGHATSCSERWEP